MILFNVTKNLVVSKDLKIADRFFDRLFGLMFKKKMDEDESLLITNCRGVHTCFMNFPIDVVFFSANKAISIITLKPWRFSKFYRSDFVIEFNAGFVYDKISIGDEIKII
jgi:uncharacterized membrane protein (UPF0127 family)